MNKDTYKGPKVHATDWNNLEDEIDESLLALQEGLETLKRLKVDPDILLPMSTALLRLIRDKRAQNKITEGWRKEAEAKILNLTRKLEEAKQRLGK